MKLDRTLFTGRDESAFTMVEIALSLAIIGFALVAILGVLPMGLTVQKENREETIINQDATIWMNAIRNGAQGYDDLTNHVIAITLNGSGVSNTPAGGPLPLINCRRIIGLLSTPTFVGTNTAGTTDYMVAYVRSISGSAVEKYPQNNRQLLDDAFSYKMIVQVFPYVPFDPNTSGSNQQQRDRQKLISALQNNSHDVRLTFRWPLLPNGTVGNNRLTFRTLAGGLMVQTNEPGLNLAISTLYFIQSPNYTNTP